MSGSLYHPQNHMDNNKTDHRTPLTTRVYQYLGSRPDQSLGCWKRYISGKQILGSSWNLEEDENMSPKEMVGSRRDIAMRTSGEQGKTLGILHGGKAIAWLL